MLQRLRNYVTPVVATVAIAILGTTAMAVSPSIVERLTGDFESEQVVNQEASEATETLDAVDEDLIIDQTDLEEEVTTPTATPTAKPVKENHGHYVSCMARMAKNDPTLVKGQKGAVVSTAAKQDVVMAKDADCSVAYAAARAQALNGQPTDGEEEGIAATSRKQQDQDRGTEPPVRNEQPVKVSNAEGAKHPEKAQAEVPGAKPSGEGSQASKRSGGNASKK